MHRVYFGWSWIYRQTIKMSLSSSHRALVLRWSSVVPVKVIRFLDRFEIRQWGVTRMSAFRLVQGRRLRPLPHRTRYRGRLASSA
jgi:hypothetical protein